MKKYLLPESGSFYKANLHCHSNLSDGKLSPEEVKALYRDLGYSVVAYTDHDIFIRHPELCDDSFLALNGFEIECNEPYDKVPYNFNVVKSCHFCAIAIDPENEIQPGWNRKCYLFGNAVNNQHLVKFDESQPDYWREHTGESRSEHMKLCRDAGFFVTYNHPVWSLEDYTDYINFHGMHAMEMFNGSCIRSGYDDYNPKVYDDMLRGGERIYCIGADDNHNGHPAGTRKSDSGWAWTMIKADSLDYKTVTKALVDGSFYASEGPEIFELWYEDGQVHIKCSDADRINYNTGRRCARTVLCDEGAELCEATFPVSPEDVYFRITVTDKRGKHACTNAYFVDSL